MNDWLIAILIGAAVGLVLGIKIARDSNQKEPVRGGVVAHIFHYLACAGMSSTIPFIITGIVLGLHFVQLFGTAVGFLAVTFVTLLIDAAIERSAPKRETAPVLTD
jgi:ABC-type Fe3+ transport system permease subunit